MFSFANPDSLYLLLLVPVLLALFILSRISTVKKLNIYGHLSTLKALMPDVSKYKPWIKISIELIIVALIVVIIARPRAGAKEQTVKVRGIEIMIALDVSNSMLASSTDDIRGVDRLQKSKLFLEKLIDKLDNDKVGLIVFAGNAYTQLPITSDFVSAKMFLNSINTNMVSTQGTAIGAAIRLAMNSFTPNEKTQKAIIVITDGENHEDDAVEMAKEAADKGIKIDVVGVGTSKGSPIPLDRAGNFLKDNTGNVVTTYLNEEMAKKIADAGKGIYVSANSTSAINDVNDQLKAFAKADMEKIVYSQHDEQFPAFAWIVLILLIIDIFVLERKISWLKNINFFTKDNKK